jgi:hypothetical protein
MSPGKLAAVAAAAARSAVTAI